MSMTDTFAEQFGNDFTEEILTELCEALCGNSSRVSIIEQVKSDAINSTGLASFEHEGKEWMIEFENGNWNGTQIRNFGEDISYRRPKQYKKVYVLDEGKIPPERLELAKTIFFRNKKEIEEMAGKMAYDMFFSPSDWIYKHYKEWGEKRCLRIETVEVKDEP